MKEEAKKLLIQATREIKSLRARLGALEQAKPVAVLGMACRFPLASNPDEFWALLQQGRDAVSRVPAERWDADSFYHPDQNRSGKVNTRWGGFIKDYDHFDAAFFGISPREASLMDPQQRLLLEVVWESLEHACIPPSSLAGSSVGVFVGVSSNEFSGRAFRDVHQLDAYTTTGATASILANRISYVYDFRGPSMTIDTACSSSLVALHQAVRALRSGDCDTALVAGVNLTMFPEGTVALGKWGALARDGRCKSFDARADGFVRGEGCGVLVLKRLAEAEDQRIWAVVRGTALNQDGATNGLTAPNGDAQVAVIRAALEDAHLKPSQIGYVEAHGTGTALGDPIEVAAITAVYGSGRKANHPCALGSVKANIGHLEGAAGIAGAIKVVLSLAHGVIPPHPSFKALNPKIELDQDIFPIPTKPLTWPEHRERLAGLSSFGFGGANAHVIFSEHAASRVANEPRDLYFLPLSVRDSSCLQTLALQVADELGPNLEEMCRTAVRGRDHHSYRLAAVGRNAQQLKAALRAKAERKPQAAARKPKLVFICSGHGSQWPGMARTLAERFPVFKSTLNKIVSRLDSKAISYLYEPESLPASVSQVQPLIFAVQVSLGRLLASLGLEPDLFMGHSLGEIAAAYLCGALDLDAALRVVVERSRAMEPLEKQGGAALVGLSSEETLVRIEGLNLALAAVNGPKSCVVAGPTSEVAALLASLKAEQIFCAPVNTDVAFHSPAMDEPAARLRAVLSDLSPGIPIRAFYSSVFASPIEKLDAEYWSNNLRKTVRFQDTLRRVLADWPQAIFVELAPHPILLPSIRETAVARLAVAPMRRHVDNDLHLAETLAELYAAGAPPADFLGAGPCATLSNYPWAHRRYEVSFPAFKAMPEFPGTVIESPLGGHLLHFPAGARLPEYVSDHQVLGKVFFPAALFIETGLEAVAEARDLVELVFHDPLIADEEREIQTLVEANRIRLFSRLKSETRWSLHFEANLAIQNGINSEATLALDSSVGPERKLTSEDIYNELTEKGLNYGPQFRILKNASAKARSAQASVLVDDSTPEAVIWDAGFQVCGLILEADAAKNAAMVPIGAARVSVFGELTSDSKVVASLQVEGESAIAEVAWFNAEGQLCREVKGLLFRRIEAVTPVEGLYSEIWQICEKASTKLALPALLFVGAADDFRSALLSQGKENAYQIAFADDPRVAAQGDMVIDLRGDLENAFHLAQIAGRHAIKTAFVTWGAAGPNEIHAPEQAGIWGLGRTFANECPDLWGGLYDLDPQNTAEANATLLIAALQAEDQQMAIRGSRFFVPLMESLTLGTSIQPRGTWLISGGGGGLGRLLADALIEKGADQVVLLGRSLATGSIRKDLHAFGCDVADEKAVAKVLEALFDNEMKPLRGVVHLAGVLRDGLIINTTDEDFTQVMRPKLEGARVLDRLTSNLDLDHFVVFSSATALLGTPGQSNYAAANASLDALIRGRRHRGLPGVSLQWGPWANIGMTANGGMPRALDSLGLDPIEAETGLNIFFAPPDRSTVCVLPMNAETFARAVYHAPFAQQRKREDAGDPVKAELAMARGQDREQILTAYLMRCLRRIMVIPEGDRMDSDLPLSRMGFDSLMTLELRALVQADLQVTLSLERMLKGPSIGELAAELAMLYDQAFVPAFDDEEWETVRL